MFRSRPIAPSIVPSTSNEAPTESSQQFHDFEPEHDFQLEDDLVYEFDYEPIVRAESQNNDNEEYEIIDFEGRVRKQTCVIRTPHVWSLKHGEKIVAHFNKHNQPVKKGGQMLSS